ncbi:hypothetical protein NIES4071_43290 [Calothrix sp. NIES-4071]|nr:hypothetical protein NIES4071_43290 [Calothrix sp. NIES-4071]BAZ58643.1 hypothetical protein NIES4105_43220 [Calothrix sp. NIES-4105]
MTINQPSNNHNENRLYTRLITILKILQFIGYFLVAIYSLAISSIYSLAINSIPMLSWLPIMFFLLGCISIYVSTQVIIAIIDLLSRIERNTRLE